MLWTGCDPVVTENPLACRVTMSGNRIVNAAFAPPPNAHMLAVQGGSGGSGSVQIDSSRHLLHHYLRIDQLHLQQSVRVRLQCHTPGFGGVGKLPEGMGWRRMRE